MQKFDELRWVSVHADVVDPSNCEAVRIKQLRLFYPELSHWGEAALNEAWGWYSEDCWLVGMMEISERDPWFLGYLYQVEQGHRVGLWNGNTQLAAQGAAALNLVR
ncbi:hypothetical protein [Methylotenera sp.]|uniref:hypothetical protein n=1 Tax=Methylotenera sp. TaxID=2051956 RepID=UPI002EDB43FA